MADTYTGITVFGLYDNITDAPLFAATGTAVPTSSILIGGSDGVNIQPLSVDSSGRLNVNASSAPPTDSKANATINGDGTGTQFVQIPTEGTSALQVQVVVAGGFDGSITFQASLDGTTFHPFLLYPVLPDGTPPVSNVTTSGQWQAPVGGMRLFQAIQITPGTTGTATVYLTAGQGQYSVVALSPNAANFNATVSGTVAVTQSTSPWLTKDAADGTPGAAAPGTAIQVAGSDGTDLRTLLTSATGQLHVITDSGSTTTVTGTVATNLTQVAGVTLGATGVTAFGTAPAAANVQGVNASIYAGTTGLTATGSSLNTNVTNTVTVTGTVSATQGTTPWIIAGNLINNNAAPGTANVGSLNYIATATPEAYTQGNQVLATTSLGGAVRVVPVDEANASSLSYFSAQSGTATIAFTSTTDKPLFSIRTNSAAFIFLVRSIQCITDGQFASFRIFKNATLTASTFATSNGHMQIDTAATSLLAGTVVWNGFVSSVPRAVDVLLDSLAAGTPGDTYTVAVTTAKAGVAANFRWSEQSAAL